VDAAGEGDVIKIATGVYTDVNTRDGLAQIVYVDKSVVICGGYTSDFEHPADPTANPTTLDALGRGRVLYIKGAISPTVKGLRIAGGNASGLGGGPWGDAGGGIYVKDASAVIRENHVFNCTAKHGGGLYLGNSSSHLAENTIVFNNAAYWGGGIDLYHSPATLTQNIIRNNTASESGGLSLYESDAILTGNTISDNTAGKYGGGGLSAYGSEATISGNTITSNTAEFGGGMSLFFSDSLLQDNRISTNTVDSYGGGVNLSRSKAILDRNVISGNTGGFGGGLALEESLARLSNTIIADNYVTTAGGGLYINHSGARLLHSTIARNRGGDGSGLCIAGWRPSFSTVTLTNTLLVSHTVGITVAAGNAITLEATLWGTHTWANDVDWGGLGTILTGAVNIWDEPGFVDPDSGDYHIGPGSAALDSAVETKVVLDIDGEQRPAGVGSDIGADELYPPELKNPVYLPLIRGNWGAYYPFTGLVELVDGQFGSGTLWAEPFLPLLATRQPAHSSQR
jgi:hypothetical protein